MERVSADYRTRGSSYAADMMTVCGPGVPAAECDSRGPTLLQLMATYSGQVTAL